MSNKEALYSRVAFASGAGHDALEASWQEAKELLENCNLEMDEIHNILFGVKKWHLVSGAHRAVIIDFPMVRNHVKLAFRLDLQIDISKAGKNYISGTFACPQTDCAYETDSFRKYASHYYLHYHKGTYLTHECCGEEFQDFPVYCKHIYEKHQNFNKITLQFQRIHEDKIEEFLDSKAVRYFASGQRRGSFRDILTSALSIMNNFGTYFIFLWNCQDFATWFLNYNGIPLNEIDPTIPDLFTGSGTDSSARSVQQVKGWMWYKKRENLKVINLDEYGGEAVCNNPMCKYIPAMKMEDLVVHRKMAHELTHNKAIEFSRKMLGSSLQFHDILSQEPRKFSFYRVRGTKLNSHEAIVLQPWTLEDNAKRIDNYCKIHIVQLPDDQGADMKFDGIRNIDKERMEHVMDVTITLQKLQLLFIAMEYSLSKIDYVTSNCVTFSEDMMDRIKENCDSVTKVSTTSWSVWIKLSLISCSNLYVSTKSLLPLLILITRSCDHLNRLISLFLFLHIAMHLMYNPYSLRDSIVEVFCSLKQAQIPEIKTLLFIPCNIGLIALGYHGIMEPSNLSAPLILYYSWDTLNVMMQEFHLQLSSGCLFLWQMEKVWNSVQYWLYYTIMWHSVKILVLLLATQNYNIYIVGQVIAIALTAMPVVVFSEHNAVTSKRLTDLPYTLEYRYTRLVQFSNSNYFFQRAIFSFYIIITVVGLFYGKGTCSFDGYNCFYAIPYLGHFTFRLYRINEQLMTTAISSSRISELVPLLETILTHNRKSHLRSTFAYLHSVRVALKISLNISKLYVILPVTWALIFASNLNIQNLHTSIVVCVTTICVASTFFVRVAFNASNNLYINMHSRYRIKEWLKGGKSREVMWKYLTGEEKVTLVPFI